MGFTTDDILRSQGRSTSQTLGDLLRLAFNQPQGNNMTSNTSSIRVPVQTFVTCDFPAAMVPLLRHALFPAQTYDQFDRPVPKVTAKVLAIKCVRMHTGLGLLEAKNFVDQLTPDMLQD